MDAACMEAFILTRTDDGDLARCRGLFSVPSTKSIPNPHSGSYPESHWELWRKKGTQNIMRHVKIKEQLQMQQYFISNTEKFTIYKFFLMIHRHFTL